MNKGIITHDILNLKDSASLSQIDDYFEGNTGDFDINVEYYYTDYPDQINYCDNKLEEICKVSMSIAQDHLSRIKDRIANDSIPEEELYIYSAWALSKVIKHEIDKKNAYWQADEYYYSSEMVDRYGSKSGAFEKGYNKYMEDHVSSGDSFLDCIIDLHGDSKTK